jgi:hypothetical protein
MARSKTKKKAVEDTGVRAEVENNSTVPIQYYIDGTFSDTPPKLKANPDIISEVVSSHQPQRSTGKQHSKVS